MKSKFELWAQNCKENGIIIYRLAGEKGSHDGIFLTKEPITKYRNNGKYGYEFANIFYHVWWHNNWRVLKNRLQAFGVWEILRKNVND